MKISSILPFLLLIAGFSSAQNIPHANFTAPWGAQVNTFNGNLFLYRSDLVIPNQGLSIDLSFSFNSFRDTIDRGFGKGWLCTYSLGYSVLNADTMLLERADGRVDVFAKINGSFKAPLGIFDRWEEYQPSQFRLATRYGMKYFFDNTAHKKLTRIEDTNGNFINLAYDANGQLTTVTDASGRSVDLVWSNGHLTTLTDGNFNPQRQVQYAYNGEGRLAQVTDFEGGTMGYAYDEKGWLSSLTNERGDELKVLYHESGAVSDVATCIAHVNFKYNPSQGKTYVTEKNSGGDRTTIYDYDEEGKLVQKTGACCGYNTIYQYDADNNVSLLTDANSQQFTANHDDRGNALFTADPSGGSQAFTFEPSLNRLQSLTDKLGNTTIFEYDAPGNLTKIQQPEGVVNEFGYGSEGSLYWLKDGNQHQTFFQYNANNDVTGIQYPIGSESFEYDPVGNLKKSIDGNGNPVSYAYDKLNRLTGIQDALNNTVAFGYDGSSNLVAETDANNNPKSYTYDAHHRLESVTTPAGTTRYAYDASDNLISITDAQGNTTTFTYDTRNLLIEERDPLGNATTYTYDGNGNVLTRTDANGKLTTYTYDALNRLTSKTYDGNTDYYQYDLNGNLVACSNNHISLSFKYDGLNRIKEKTVNNWGKTIRYEYDAAGNRAKMTDPDGGETHYEYDGNNRLVKITNPQGQQTVFAYDTGGRLTQQTNWNGTAATYEYDPANRLTLLEHKTASGSILARYAYSHDGNGNRLSMTTQSNGTANYTYDGDNRLTAAHYENIALPDQSFEFDSTGNRTGLVTDGVPTTYAYDAADRLQSAGAATYAFNANGNLTQKTDANGATTHYYYDGENRLVRVELPGGSEVNFEYDPFGNRISQKSAAGTTRYFLDGDNVLMELDASGNTLARYTAGLSLDSWISMDRGGQSYCYHTDGLGSVTALTDASQAVVATYLYDAYGNIATQTGSVANPYTYTGREWDSATGLYYYRTRYYDAGVGRFLTRDVVEGSFDRPLSLNKYGYVENNPTTYVDPEGEYWALIWEGIVITYRVGVAGYKLITTIGKVIGKVGQRGKNLALKVLVRTKLFQKYKNNQMIKLLRKVNRACRAQLKNMERTELDKIINELSGKKYEDDIEFWKYIIKKLRDGFSNEDDKNKEKENYLIEKLRETPCGKLYQELEDAAKGFEELFGNKKETVEAEVEIPIIRAVDPNEILPPDGCGTNHWVAKSTTLPYTILFENDPDFATAPAQTVVIELPLDPQFNPASFRVGDFGFGNYYFTAPANVSYYNTQLDLSDSLGVLLDVVAGVDVNSTPPKAFWILEAKDPATGLAATLPANVGFLPVNDTLTHVGEGFVNFILRAKTSAITFDTLHARANIVFDDNPAIETNLAFNLIDADLPVSQVTGIDTLPANQYELTWAGSDVGSGISSYVLYVSENSGPFLPQVGDLTGTNYTWQGTVGNSYEFFLIATDCAGNVEPLKNGAETGCALSITLSQTPAVNGQANGSASVQVAGNIGTLTYLWSNNATNPINANLLPGAYAVTVTDGLGCTATGSVTVENSTGTQEADGRLTGLFIQRIYPVPAGEQVRVEFFTPSSVVFVEVFTAEGKKLMGKTCEAKAGEVNTVPLDVSGLAAGSYLVKVRTRGEGVSGVFVKG